MLWLPGVYSYRHYYHSRRPRPRTSQPGHGGLVSCRLCRNVDCIMFTDRRNAFQLSVESIPLRLLTLDHHHTEERESWDRTRWAPTRIAGSGSVEDDA